MHSLHVLHLSPYGIQFFKFYHPNITFHCIFMLYVLKLLLFSQGLHIKRTVCMQIETVAVAIYPVSGNSFNNPAHGK